MSAPRTFTAARVDTVGVGGRAAAALPVGNERRGGGEERSAEVFGRWSARRD
jgi:hypothetical protein